MGQIRGIARVGLIPILLCLPVDAATCESLTSAGLPRTTIASAQIVTAGVFLPPTAANPAAPPAIYKALPAFCRVQGVIQPSGDSHIEFEVWLPESNWNGKYMAVGNGGFAGSIAYADGRGNVPGLAEALLAGYAASSTDTGHKASDLDARWALGHPEKVIDYGYRAIHETAEKAKAIIRAFYGRDSRQSYFNSCSNGGREALMEAQRFPADYDGIIAGAPANAVTHLLAGFTMNVQATESDPASYIPPTKLPALEAAALEACDGLDGLKDGVIDDPRKCKFDPAVLLCQGAESDSCLTQPQVAALKKIYTGTRTSRGDQIYPGYFVGGETGARGWARWITGIRPTTGLEYMMATQAGPYLVFQNSSWDYRSFNLERDIKVMDDAVGQYLNATDPNLTGPRPQHFRRAYQHCARTLGGTGYSARPNHRNQIQDRR